MDGETETLWPNALIGAGGQSANETLMHAVEKHVESETQILTEYRALAESSTDAVIKVVLDVILDDEERHHELMRRIVDQLKRDSARDEQDSRFPEIRTDQSDASTYATLRRFVMAESATAGELRSIASQALSLHGSLLFELLTAMALDSAKHEHLFRFLFRHVGHALGEASTGWGVSDLPGAHHGL